MNSLKRELSTRHLVMIALGGSIGTGIFVASGATVATAGPGGALVAYFIVGFMVYLFMQALGELSSYMPLTGAFEEYASKYVSPSFGFAVGWNYWFSWAITVAAELVAAAIIMKFWFPDTSSTMWSGLFLAIILLINYFRIRVYGESEFWFASVKVIAVVLFIIVGILMIFGIMNGNDSGFHNWILKEAPFVNGWTGILLIMMIAGYSFQGTEIIGIASGETKEPEKAVPKAINTVFWRILLFYILTIVVIGTLVAYDDPNLLKNSDTDIAFSPFTMVFERAGIALAASIMNAVIFTAVFSAGNSGLYASTRMLYSLSKNGKAPKILSKLDKRGVPIIALAATTFVALACFLSTFIGDGFAYIWLLTMSALCGFITWVCIGISHLHFRRKIEKDGNIVLPYKTRIHPYGTIIALIICVIIMLGQCIDFIKSKDWWMLISCYSSTIVFLILWSSHKYFSRRRLVND